jgi:alpha-L-fucosidase
MAFTTKHHDGFAMWHTKTRVVRRMNFLDTANVIEPCNLAYSIEETPFKRDIVKELCDAAHKNNIKIDLYFSHPDWYDADFRPHQNHPLGTPKYFENPELYGTYGKWPPRISVPDPTPEEIDHQMKRHREQLLELVTNYGKIDMMCFDGNFSLEMWPEMKKTVKMIRELQPDVMLRNRGINNYGDYYTPERVVPEDKENTNMPWMVIYPLTEKWSYDSDASHYKGAPWIIHNIIDCAAKGGSFMVGTGPDKTGVFHPEAVRQLEETGRWLKVNGAGIYATRAREVWKEHDVFFTRTKDHKKVFAFVEQWPGKEIVIPAVTPKKGSKIYLLGYKKALKWSQSGTGIKVEIPDILQSPENRPCEHAWGFEINVSNNQ